MTNSLAAVAYLVSAEAPNRLETARAAGAIARAAGGRAAVVVAPGAGCAGLDLCGVDRVIEVGSSVVEAQTGDLLGEIFLAALAAADADVSGAAVLLPYGTLEEEVSARIADALDGTVFGKCGSIELTDGGCTIERPVYGGRATARLRSTAGPFVCIVRPSLVVETAAIAASVEQVSVEVPSGAPAVERVPHDGPRQPPLEGARIIIAGGKGLGSAEAFEMLEEIAGEVSGVVGCSLPVADAGWRPISRQIGQSGKFVNPDVYLAVAISGASQHMAGIGEKAPIFAVNNDPDAAIWQVHSDWGKPMVGIGHVYQRGPNSIRTKAKARAAINVLEEHGWLHAMPDGAEIEGQRHRDAWRVIPPLSQVSRL